MRLAIRNVVVHGCAALSLLFVTDAAMAQAPEATSAAADGNSVPITTLISTVAKRTGKKFVVDPRVRSDVMLIGESPASISYEDFLTVMQVHGFAVVESEDLVRVVPDAGVRQLSLPIAQGKEKRFDSEYVTKVIAVRNTPAAMLVPMLRPLLPQQAHLAAAVCSNDLIIVDTVANVKRIESLVQSLDKGEPFKVKECAAREAAGGESKT
jgi:type II secretory pathway component GspD/PulD (secretin)